MMKPEPKKEAGYCSGNATRSAFRVALQRESRQLAGVDARSLAAFRIGLGVLLVVDLILRSEDLVAHYTDSGVLPRTAAISLYNNSAHFSLHLMSGAWQFQAALFVLAGALAVALALGYRTRIVTVASWTLLVSLQARNTNLLNGGDSLMRLLLFWSMFLPLGSRWSIDSYLKRNKSPTPLHVVSVGTFAVQIQICLMYWFACLSKTDPVWTTDGTAIYYALNVDQISKPIGRSLLAYPRLLRSLTFSSLYLEGIGPFFFFLPRLHRWTRPTMVLVFVSFHIVMGVCLAIGLFSWACCVALILFLPASCWNLIGDKTNRLVTSATCFIRSGTAPRSTDPHRPTITSISTSGVHSTGLVRFTTNMLALMFLCLVVIWNFRTLNTTRPSIPAPLKRLTRLARLEQKWNMFAPYPLRDDGWFVFEGELNNGEKIDLFAQGGPITDEKPGVVHLSFANARWRKYMGNLWKRRNSRARKYYGEYMMRNWDQQHADERKLTTAELYYWEEYTQLESPPKLRKVLLWKSPGLETPAATIERPDASVPNPLSVSDNRSKSSEESECGGEEQELE